MKKIYASLPSFSSGGEAIGKKTADQGFLKALLTYSRFDEFHFFLIEEAQFPAFSSYINSFIKDKDIISKIRLFTLDQINDCLSTFDYHIFNTHDTLIDRVLLFRNNYKSKTNFPVTGYTHTLSGPLLLPHYLQILLAHPKHYDGIVCSSSGGQQVVSGILSHYARSFNKAYEADISFKGQLPIIPLGVEKPEVTPKETARGKLNLPRDKKIILSLSRINFLYKMDFAPLLLVFSRLLKQEPDVMLIIAGAMRESEKVFLTALNQQIKDLQLPPESILIKTNISEEEKNLLYSSSDIFVSPSDHIQETFGLTILEAMASGLPVVCSDWDGYKDLVEHEKTGYRIPTYWTKNPPQLQYLTPFTELTSYILSQGLVIDLTRFEEYLLALLNDQNLRDAMGQKGKERANKHFSWTTIMGQYETLWNSLKEESLKHPQNDRTTVDLTYPITDIFGHYPTSFGIPPGTSKLQLTEYGQKILKGEISLVIPTTLKTYIKPGILQTIIKSTASGEANMDILDIFSGKYPQEIITYNLNWLVKKGIVGY